MFGKKQNCQRFLCCVLYEKRNVLVIVCLLQVGMTLHCRVLRVNMEKFQVDLTCKTSDLTDKDGKYRYVDSRNKSLLMVVPTDIANRASIHVTESDF